MTQGLLLETQLENYLKLNHIPVRHASVQEDRFQAIDLWVSGLAIQVTIGDWTTAKGLSQLKSKLDWTLFQSKGKAILVVFPPRRSIAMFRQMAIKLLQLKKAGATGPLVLLVDEQGCKVLRP